MLPEKPSQPPIEPKAPPLTVEEIETGVREGIYRLVEDTEHQRFVLIPSGWIPYKRKDVPPLEKN